MRAMMQLSSIKLPVGCSLRVVAMMISATENNCMVEIDVKLLIFTDMLVRTILKGGAARKRSQRQPLRSQRQPLVRVAAQRLLPAEVLHNVPCSWCKSTPKNKYPKPRQNKCISPEADKDVSTHFIDISP